MSPVFLTTNQSPYFLSKTGTLPFVYNGPTLLFVYKPTFPLVYNAAPSLLTTVNSKSIIQCTLSLTSLTCNVQSSLGLEHSLYVSCPCLILCHGRTATAAKNDADGNAPQCSIANYYPTKTLSIWTARKWRITGAGKQNLCLCYTFCGTGGAQVGAGGAQACDSRRRGCASLRQPAQGVRKPALASPGQGSLIIEKIPFSEVPAPG